ncbi:CHY zinc finger protein [Salimicrobium humidisoli]|uniref:CHY-type domain-containing protein n=1 Tax=Salimicrobium humidisoli TaxID=2029857 RepID=A0ABX4HPW9_9BACI|nr:CHY zinc finger protein [Salimicrobium humidisoli]PBB05118.1 hypothetical protein CKW00_10575 [Salimicrobium humidisoli]
MDIHGIRLDDKTRCHHYHNYEDVVAIKFYCCGEYYACIKCHEEMAEHEVEVWPSGRQGEPGIYCGNCRREMAVAVYKKQTECPYCSHPFNPGCRLHFPHYFE